MVQRILSKHFEVLGFMLRRLLRILCIKGIQKTGAFDRALRDSVHLFGLLNPGRFQNGRNDVNHMAELITKRTLVSMCLNAKDSKILK